MPAAKLRRARVDAHCRQRIAVAGSVAINVATPVQKIRTLMRGRMNAEWRISTPIAVLPGTRSTRGKQPYEGVDRDFLRERGHEVVRGVGGQRQEHRRAAERIDDRPQCRDGEQHAFDEVT